MPSQDTEFSVGIVVAVREEQRAILKRASPAIVESVDGFEEHRFQLSGTSVTLIRSGMGRERAERAAELLIRRYHPRSIMAAGFCAGLSESLKPGDLVISEFVMDIQDGNGSADFRTSYQADNGLIEAATSTPCSIRTSTGGILTTSAIARDSKTKLALANSFPNCMALDMESAGVARAVSANGVPWIGIRAVTDAVQDELPLDFADYAKADGELSRSRIALAVLVRPWSIPSFLRLARRSALAARNLAVFVEAFVAVLPTLARK
jgi:adenosylhomocysteine nucleosidase